MLFKLILLVMIFLIITLSICIFSKKDNEEDNFAILIGNPLESKLTIDYDDTFTSEFMSSSYLLKMFENDASKMDFNDEIKMQAEIAIDEADVVIFIVDGKEGLTSNDLIVRDILRRSKKEVIVAINKMDTKLAKDNIYDFYELGFDTYIPISSIHNMGYIELMDTITNDFTKKEEIKANPKALELIAKKSNGDMRSAINTLQALADKDKVLEPIDVENLRIKDDRSDIFNDITGVLKSKNPQHVREAMRVDEDPTLVMEYIAENIPREYRDKNEIKKAYENIAKADLYFGRAQQSRYYGYWKYASDFMGIGVSSSKRETYKKFSKIQTPTIFTLMSRNRGKRNLRDGIAEKMSEKMHISHAIAISMFPYLEIMFKNDELAWEISDFLELEDTEIKRFRSKKIPKKVITKMEAKKAQMRVEERDKRFEELQKQMINAPEEIEIVEEPADSELPFEIPGIDSEEETVEEEPQIEVPKKEDVEEKKPKKKTDKQVSLFSF